MSYVLRGNSETSSLLQTASIWKTHINTNKSDNSCRSSSCIWRLTLMTWHPLRDHPIYGVLHTDSDAPATNKLLQLLLLLMLMTVFVKMSPSRIREQRRHFSADSYNGFCAYNRQWKMRASESPNSNYDFYFARARILCIVSELLSDLHFVFSSDNMKICFH